jgi:hypothetical protein
MKKNHSLIISMGIIVLIFVLTGISYSQGTRFTTPRKGDTIENRQDFIVSLTIDKFDKTTGHYWVAIATVTRSTNWERVLELYKKSGSKSGDAVREEQEEMKNLIAEWKIDQVWPKFYVPVSPYQGRVFDGGQNPMKGIDPQPMILLILKVDDTLQDYFRGWFQAGEAGKGYPGIPVSRFSQTMILARCEIFFP